MKLSRMSKNFSIKATKISIFTILLFVLVIGNLSIQADPPRPVVGGTPVNISDYPYQVSLESKVGASYAHFCGGSIISEYWILSAAHCVPTTLPQDLYIRIGFTSLNVPSGQIFQVDSIIVHPSYNNVSQDNDIALIKLKTQIDFNSLTAAKVRLATSTDESAGFYNEGTTVRVTGWGHTSYGGSGSNQLLMGEMQIYSNSTVMSNWGTYVGALTSNMITAGLEAGGIDACQGDSGGPLVARDNTNSEYIQVGIVSWGDNCAAYRKPGVYTKVNRYNTWIDSYTKVKAVEKTNLPNDGDGNGDGKIDSLQTNVTTIQNYLGTGYITISTSDGLSLTNVKAKEPFTSQNLSFPFGVVEFKINASTATVKLYYHGVSDLSNYVYRKLLSNNTQINYSNAVFGSEIIGGKKVATVTLTLTDGGLGDYDGIVNGVIYDPGGPAIASSNIPTISEWARIFLISLLVVFGVWKLRRYA